MYREAVLEFIRRKNEVLDGEYIPGYTPEELWPFGEEESEKVVRVLSHASDVSLCPWCLLSSVDCNNCKYGETFGSCLDADGNNYSRILEEVTKDKSIATYIEDNGDTEYVLEPIEEVKNV